MKAGIKRVTRKRGKAAILTASSYKTELEECNKKTQNIKDAKIEKIKQRLALKGRKNIYEGMKTKPKKQKKIRSKPEEYSENREKIKQKPFLNTKGKNSKKQRLTQKNKK